MEGERFVFIFLTSSSYCFILSLTQLPLFLVSFVFSSLSSLVFFFIVLLFFLLCIPPPLPSILYFPIFIFLISLPYLSSLSYLLLTPPYSSLFPPHSPSDPALSSPSMSCPPLSLLSSPSSPLSLQDVEGPRLLNIDILNYFFPQLFFPLSV